MKNQFLFLSKLQGYKIYKVLLVCYFSFSTTAIGMLFQCRQQPFGRRSLSAVDLEALISQFSEGLQLGMGVREG